MRPRIPRAISVGLICIAISAGGSQLLAKHYGANTPWPKKKAKPNTTQPTTQPDAPTTAPVVDDSIGKAQAAMLAAEARAKHKFESTDEWTTAQSAASKALADVHTANSSVGSSVRHQSEYTAAADQVAQAEEKLQQARESGADASEISSAAASLMNARTALSAFQSRAATSDPALVAAREKLSAANLAVEQLRKREIAYVLADPGWQAAKKAYDEARGKIASAAR